MKKLMIATLIGAGLLGWNATDAEASASANHAGQKANVHYQVKHVNSYKWYNDQNWCEYVFKDSEHHYENKQNNNNGQVSKPAPENKQNTPVVEKPSEQPKQPAPAPSKPAPEQTPNKPTEQVNQGLTAEEQQMLDLVNAERQKNGVKPLTANLELTKVARLKAQDMIDKNYFDHQSPTYGSPFDMMKQFGISYRTAGENIAGNQTVDKAHTSLMNSEGHRANILNSSYTEVGIGIVDGGPYGKMFVQMFKG